MSLEKKVYPSFAFSADEQEKSKINYEIYKELCENYKFLRTCSDNHDVNDYELVMRIVPKYNSFDAVVVKNTTTLSDDEIALIADTGNLCFGYSKRGNTYTIWTD